MSTKKYFTITAQEQVSVWQNTTYIVEAETEEEAKAKIKANPQEHCANIDEVLTDTEKVLEVDFESDNYTCEY